MKKIHTVYVFLYSSIHNRMKRGIERNQNETMYLKYKVINVYNYILEHFCKDIPFGCITKMERGIITADGEEYYKDYFETTHTELKKHIQEHYNVQEPTLMVNRLFNHKNETLLFSTEVNEKKTNKEVIYTDEIYEKIPKNIRHLFERKINELRIEEKMFRNRKRSEEMKAHTKEDIVKDLMIEDIEN